MRLSLKSAVWACDLVPEDFVSMPIYHDYSYLLDDSEVFTVTSSSNQHIVWRNLLDRQARLSDIASLPTAFALI